VIIIALNLQTEENERRWREMVEINPHLEEINITWEKYKRLIHLICKKYAKMAINNSKFDYEDIFNEASIGFVKAYKKFDPTKFEKPIRFTTYLWAMAEGEIRRYLRDYSHDLHVSRSIKDLLGKIHKSDVDDWDPQVLSESLAVSVKEIEEALRYQSEGKPMFLHKVVFDDGSTNGAVTLMEMISDNTDFFPKFSDIEHDDSVNYMMSKMKEALTEREFAIFRDSVLLDKSQRDIGMSFGISQVQVSRILIKVKTKLKESFNKTEYREEMNMAKELTKEAAKAIELIKTTDKTYAEISEITGASYPTVAYHGKKNRGIVDPSKSKSIRRGKVKDKDRMNGPVITRQMTNEERIKHGLEPLPETKPIVIPKMEESVEEPVVNALQTKVKTEEKIERETSINSSIVLNSNNIEIDLLESEVSNIVKALKILGIKSVNLKVESN
jgi:RNA polymerase sporulation-specific sigma factor